MNNAEQLQAKQKELFDMVYRWGEVRIVTDYRSEAYQKTLKELYDLQRKQEEVEAYLDNGGAVEDLPKSTTDDWGFTL